MVVRKIRSCALRRGAHNHGNDHCAGVRMTMMMSMVRRGAQGAHDHGREQGTKRGVRNIYTTYIGCAHPTYAEVGSRAISSRTTTTHPATQVGTKP